MCKIFNKILLLSSIIIIVGCVNRPVDPSAKDVSGTYSGNWFGTVALKDERQYYSGEVYECGKFDTMIVLNVKDGVVNGEIGEGIDPFKFTAVIDPSGYFYTEIPAEEGFDVTPRTGPNIQADAAYLIKGNLNAQTSSGKGVFMVAKVSSKRGCAADFDVVKS